MDASTRPLRRRHSAPSKRIAEKVTILRRRFDFLTQKTQGGAIHGYSSEERCALEWLLAVIDGKCCCEGADDSDPCFHCATHGVIAARRVITDMGKRQSDVVKYLRDVAPEGIADEAYRMLHPRPDAAPSGGLRS